MENLKVSLPNANKRKFNEIEGNEVASDLDRLEINGNKHKKGIL